MKRTTLTTVVVALIAMLAMPAMADDAKPEAKPEIKIAVKESKVVLPAVAVPTAVAAPVAEPAAAPAAPDVKIDAGEQVDKMIDAAQKKEWSVFIGLGLMLLIWIIGMLWKAFPSAWLPYLSISLGVFATMAVDMSQGVLWWRAMLAGFTTGGAATGFWEMLGKKVLGGSRTKRLEAKNDAAKSSKEEVADTKADDEDTEA